MSHFQTWKLNQIHILKALLIASHRKPRVVDYIFQKWQQKFILSHMIDHFKIQFYVILALLPLRLCI